MTTPATATGLSASVGSAPAANKPADVTRVQELLNLAGASLVPDGACGPRTIAMIRDYQRNFLSAPDGRIDPGGVTWRHLLERKLAVKSTRLVQLPRVGGGYYTISPAANQWGTPATIQALRDVAGQFAHDCSGLAIGIGDISLQHGGRMPPHNSHTAGRHVDIRPLRTDKRRDRVTISDAAYSREFTTLLVDCLFAHRNVKAILFNDTHIARVRSWPGHHNHLHVTMKE